jgi:alpha-L-rhamnosidase
MKLLFKLLLALCCLGQTVLTYGQAGDNQTSTTQWNAQWIAATGDNGADYGVFYFRKSVDLTTKPSKFIVHVSADNRYKLYVNGTLVSLGRRAAIPITGIMKR